MLALLITHSYNFALAGLQQTQTWHLTSKESDKNLISRIMQIIA
jgi:hypothetical protein